MKRALILPLAVCAFSSPARAGGQQVVLNPMKPAAHQPKLIATGRTKLGNGYLMQYHTRWTVVGKAIKSKDRVRGLGRATVIRKYTPKKVVRGGKKVPATEINQIVYVLPDDKVDTAKLLQSQGAQTLAGVVSLAQELHINKQPGIWQDAIRGAVHGLDPHSRWNRPIKGGAGGLGVELQKKGKLKVTRSRRGSPAYKAGIRRGDELVAVNRRPVKTFDEAAALTPGRKGTYATVKVLRKGQPKVFRVQRDVIAKVPVKTRLSPDGIGYIRLAQFDATTGADFSSALAKLIKRNDRKQLRGLVLDLRDNGGGDLIQAVKVVDNFVAEKTIVTTKGRKGQKKYRTEAKTPFAKLPLAVLVNRASASSSEIIAGALQDLKRATVIGERTYGKTTVQEQMTGLPDGSTLDLTVGRYYLPSGRRPQRGITPHISRDQAKNNYHERLQGKKPPAFRDYVLEEAFAALR